MGVDHRPGRTPARARRRLPSSTAAGEPTADEHQHGAADGRQGGGRRQGGASWVLRSTASLRAAPPGSRPSRRRSITSRRWAGSRVSRVSSTSTSSTPTRTPSRWCSMARMLRPVLGHGVDDQRQGARAVGHHDHAEAEVAARRGQAVVDQAAEHQRVDVAARQHGHRRVGRPAPCRPAARPGPTAPDGSTTCLARSSRSSRARADLVVVDGDHVVDQGVGVGQGERPTAT